MSPRWLWPHDTAPVTSANSPLGLAGRVTAVPSVGTALICAVAGVGLAGAVLAIGVGRRRCTRASA